MMPLEGEQRLEGGECNTLRKYENGITLPTAYYLLWKVRTARVKREQASKSSQRRSGASASAIMASFCNSVFETVRAESAEMRARLDSLEQALRSQAEVLG